jgi:hypothetical protein
MLKSIIRTALVLYVVAPTGVAAQLPENQASILAVVVRDFASVATEESLRLRLDPRLAPEGDMPLGALRDFFILSPGDLGEILSGTEVRVARCDETIRCPEGPSSCQFVGADAVVTLSRPTVEGNLAIAWVKLQRKSASAREPVELQIWRLQLNWNGENWELMKRTLIGVS